MAAVLISGRRYFELAVSLERHRPPGRCANHGVHPRRLLAHFTAQVNRENACSWWLDTSAPPVLRRQVDFNSLARQCITGTVIPVNPPPSRAALLNRFTPSSGCPAGRQADLKPPRLLSGLPRAAPTGQRRVNGEQALKADAKPAPLARPPTGRRRSTYPPRLFRATDFELKRTCRDFAVPQLVAPETDADRTAESCRAGLYVIRRSPRRPPDRQFD